jgi:hypothetical protein
MTPKQSTARLVLYCLAAFLTPIGANWAQMGDATLHQWVGMIIQASISTVIAARAYIDQSPNQIEKP